MLKHTTKLRNPAFKALPTTSRELQLRATLLCGQCFRWKEVENTWMGVFRRSVVCLKQEGDQILYKQYGDTEDQDLEESLSDYFQLKHNLTELYSSWGQASNLKGGQKKLKEEFTVVSKRIPGLRLLRQDPFECLFSFICSQNNNIPRIKSLIEKLSVQYGTKLMSLDGVDYYSFPTLQQLETATESKLSELGFGYRSKYIVEAAKQVKAKGGDEWLLGLREKTAEETQNELVQLMGVGKKVADCVALFSLDQLHAVPVDTHVFQIAHRYMKGLNEKLSPASYVSIRAFFHETFGPLAGWAHTVLFAAELPDFKQEEASQEEQDDEEQPEQETKTRAKKRKSDGSEKKTPPKKKSKAKK